MRWILFYFPFKPSNKGCLLITKIKISLKTFQYRVHIICSALMTPQIINHSFVQEKIQKVYFTDERKIVTLDYLGNCFKDFVHFFFTFKYFINGPITYCSWANNLIWRYSFIYFYKITFSSIGIRAIKIMVRGQMCISNMRLLSIFISPSRVWPSIVIMHEKSLFFLVRVFEIFQKRLKLFW